jgi:trimeric autotransporter adhesin
VDGAVAEEAADGGVGSERAPTTASVSTAASASAFGAGDPEPEVSAAPPEIVGSCSDSCSDSCSPADSAGPSRVVRSASAAGVASNDRSSLRPPSESAARGWAAPARAATPATVATRAAPPSRASRSAGRAAVDSVAPNMATAAMPTATSAGA